MAKKILITEDSPTVLEILKSVLAEEGYEVIAASDGQQALNLAKTEKPDLMVLDLMLPKIDGYKVCRMLKFDEKYKDIPIIMLTARTNETDERLGKEVGADAYIKKPFQPEVVIDEIKKLLNR
jgi:two-component system, OmpR family, alkaline phosphatase synthesis response regulator PhoP